MVKEDFIRWMKSNSKLSNTTIVKYANAINTISTELSKYNMLEEDLFKINNPSQVEEMIEKYFSIPEFEEKDIRGNRMYSNALKQYKRFTDTINIDNKKKEVEYQPTNNSMLVKEVSSWSKIDKVNLIGRKKVDWSMLKEGTTIPIQFHNDFEMANHGRHLELGEKEKVTFIINDKKLDAILTNVDRKVNADTLQLKYGKEVAELFKSVFHSSYDFINEQREMNSNKSIVVPDDRAEYIEFYKTDHPFVYRLNFITQGSSDVDMEQFLNITSKELIDHVYHYIKSKGFYYPKEEVINLFLIFKIKTLRHPLRHLRNR